MGDDGRKMIYPFTISQKLKHFPYKFHWKYCPRFREICLSVLLCIPVFYGMQKLSFSPSNVKKYEEYLEKEEVAYRNHLRHLEGYYEDQHGH